MLKSRTLSFASRVALAKSIMQALPSYEMQMTLLPKGVCDDIDKACLKFIWVDMENDNKIHLVSWDTICSPKLQGNLSLRKA